ncbi:MAG: ribulose-5-phosphate reductase [Candidatus Improbicoccus devescovinae]|nr:MAG: ribulose-5-phosphate reductase [Candidatus Improbicoccus devescovinae]
MIGHICTLTRPGRFEIYCNDIPVTNKTLVRPKFMSLCHADNRYFRGLRSAKVLEQKLPMALIHECWGEVIFDPLDVLKPGQKVVLIPNVPPDKKELEIYENYQKNCKFLSSDSDGFMQEIIAINNNRLIPFDFDRPEVACVCEMISVAVHAVNRLISMSHSNKKSIGIWGDGSLGYFLALVMHELLPDTKIFVIGKNINKLSFFSFVENTYLINEIPENFVINHAFECAGGKGSEIAINDIIKYTSPQGCVMLLGVSEEHVLVNTRDILAKGLIFIGCSRSGFNDFSRAINFLNNENFRDRIASVIYFDEPVRCIQDIYRVFDTDLKTTFKTAFEWAF